MKKYILLYGDKKTEDIVCITNMFKNSKKINLGWTDFDNNNNMKIIDELIKDNIKQIIFLGLEVGWDILVKNIREKYSDIKIKIICNTQDSLLYYDYERENFLKLLQLSKENIIDSIGFLKRGQYELYKKLGYKCIYLMQNFTLEPEEKKQIKNKNDIIDIGIYPLNYTWDKNIFNQLCISKFIDNSKLNYNLLDDRMEEFINTMGINGKADRIEKIDKNSLIDKVIKNDINISCSFTEYFHTIFFVSMEQGVPCLIGNTSDLFEENQELKNYVVTLAEDNPIENAKNVKRCLENRERIIQLYKEWKSKYNEKAKKSIEAFIEK